MLRIRTVAIALATTTLMGSAAFAAEQPAKAAAQQPAKTAPQSGAQRPVDQAFGKLSADGFKAFRDVRLARLAIFNARPDEAKTYVDQARAALAKAKTDDTSFTKAEAALKPPAGMAQAGDSKEAASTTPITWIPVNGALTIGEDYVATPEKAAGVAKANEQLKKGERNQALETLKAANVDVTFVEEVAPLDKSVAGVDKAAQLIGEGHYYEANQALKNVEDGLRFDVAEMTAVPGKSGNTNTPPAASANPPAGNTAAPAKK